MTGPGSSQVQQAYQRKTGWIAPVFKQLSLQTTEFPATRIQSCETQIDSKHGPGLVVFLQIKRSAANGRNGAMNLAPIPAGGTGSDGGSLVPRSLIGIEDTLPCPELGRDEPKLPDEPAGNSLPEAAVRKKLNHCCKNFKGRTVLKNNGR